MPHGKIYQILTIFCRNCDAMQKRERGRRKYLFKQARALQWMFGKVSSDKKLSCRMACSAILRFAGFGVALKLWVSALLARKSNRVVHSTSGKTFGRAGFSANQIASRSFIIWL